MTRRGCKTILACFLAVAVLLVAVPRDARATCSSPAGVAGDVIWNKVTGAPQYCDDTDWVGFPKGGVSEVEWVMVSGSDAHMCGIRTNGSLWCWGAETDGELGNGGAVAETHGMPVPVAETGPWIDVSVGHKSGVGEASCAIKADGTLWCWGDDAYAQMGNGAGDTSDKASPVQISDAGPWTQVSVGFRSACAVKADETLWCWGTEISGELGNGGATSETQHDPVQVNDAGPWQFVSRGQGLSATTCGIKTDGSLWCWGSDGDGLIGNGATTTTTQASPVASSEAGPWANVDVGYKAACGVKVDETLWCWGRDDYAQIGNGAATGTYTAPVNITGGGAWASVSVKMGGYGETSCALRTDGSAWCWGYNQDGQAGNGVTGANLDVPTAVTIVPGPWRQVESVGWHSCGIVQAGNRLVCWAGGQLDDMSVLGGGFGVVPGRVQTPPGDGWSMIDGGRSTCGIKTDGTAWCWGRGASGQLGNGTTPIQQDWPVAVSDAGPWASISTGDNSSSACGVKVDGTGMCWGSNASGKTGLGTTAGNQTTPATITEAGPWRKIEVGGSHTCGLKMDGTLWCWGSELFGAIGNGSTAGTQSNPVQLADPGPWIDVSAEWRVSCGVKADGTAWCWGEGTSGELGDGLATDSSVPVQVADAGPWVKIDAGYFHTCGVKDDGTAWCWGAGWTALGDGVGADVDVPVQVAGGGTWADVSAGVYQTCGIQTDGSGWCWGNEVGYELGNGDIATDQLSPVQILSPGSWAQIDAAGHDSSGIYYTCGVKANGSGWCWGSAYEGALGYGTAQDPVVVDPGICANPAGVTGDIVYNQTNHVLQYCADGVWKVSGPPGNGGAGCVNPAADEGAVIFNSALAVLQYCEGDAWIRVGREP